MMFFSIVSLVILIRVSVMVQIQRQGLATEDYQYHGLTDEFPFFIWEYIDKSECALECLLKRCTFFFYNEFEMLCNLHNGDIFFNLTSSVGWKYFNMEVRCPSTYNFLPSSYSCLRLYLPGNSTYTEKSAKCAEHGGALARIDTPEKQFSVEEYLGDFQASPFMIVLIQGKRPQPNQQHVYNDGSHLIYDNWGDLQPGNPDFMAINVSDFYHWYSIPATIAQVSSFLCEVIL